MCDRTLKLGTVRFLAQFYPLCAPHTMILWGRQTIWWRDRRKYKYLLLTSWKAFCHQRVSSDLCQFFCRGEEAWGEEGGTSAGKTGIRSGMHCCCREQPITKIFSSLTLMVAFDVSLGFITLLHQFHLTYTICSIIAFMRHQHVLTVSLILTFASSENE